MTYSYDYAVIVWWKGRMEPTLMPHLTKEVAFDVATIANRLSAVADARASTWNDACALLEAEAKERSL